MQMLKRYTHLRAEDLVGKLDAIGKKIGHRLRLDSLPSPVGDVLQQKA
jgi:hypothetical protein